MTLHTIKRQAIDRLVREGTLKREYNGDNETGRVFWEDKMTGMIYYYHPAKANPKFYVREDRF